IHVWKPRPKLARCALCGREQHRLRDLQEHGHNGNCAAAIPDRDFQSPQPGAVQCAWAVAGDAAIRGRQRAIQWPAPGAIRVTIPVLKNEKEVRNQKSEETKWGGPPGPRGSPWTRCSRMV